MSNKKITQLPLKTTTVQADDLFEVAEVQPGGTFISKKLTGSELISLLPAGPQGPQGDVGPVGPAGPTGDTGATGPQGPAGVNAVSGITYAGDWDYVASYHPGDFVTYGNQVYICSTLVGPVGPAEDPTVDTVHWTLLSIEGAQGPIGPSGVDGAVGPQGPVGPAGPTGPQGPVGPAGPQGIQGVDGPIGATGPQGPAGPVGPVATGSFTHWIGEKYEGGTIAHLWKDNLGVEHGLILCENNVIMDGIGIPQPQGPLIPVPNTTWPGWPTGAPTSSTDGQANTSAIVAQFGSSNPYYGPYACDQLVYGGKSDWYLPSVFEMFAIKQNAFAINLAIQALGSGDQINLDAQYWTSTFYTINSALVVGNLFYWTFSAPASSQNYVRAIRKF